MKKTIIVFLMMILVGSMFVLGYNQDIFKAYNLDLIPQNIRVHNYTFENGVHKLINKYDTVGINIIYTNYTVPIVTPKYNQTTKTWYNVTTYKTFKNNTPIKDYVITSNTFEYEVTDTELQECIILYGDTKCVDVYLTINAVKTSLAQKRDIARWKTVQYKLNNPVVVSNVTNNNPFN